jgi:hypothetical protein
MPRGSRFLALITTTAAVLAAAAGCSSPAHHPAFPVTSSAAATQPLTGLPVSASGAELHRPAVLVKIENSPQARPQSGLDLADVVYEAVAEGGITRFAAVYQSVDPGRVGPVRSVRPQDADIAGPLHGLAAFAGGLSAFVAPLDAVAQDLSVTVLGERAPYLRTTDRRAPHNLYVEVAGLWARADADHRDPPQPLFTYGALDPSATPAAALTVTMSPSAVVRWTWDGTAWRRSQNGAPFSVTGAGRIGPADVLVQVVRTRATTFVDPAGTVVPASELIGTGQAMLLRDGHVLRGTWSKPDRTTATAFLTPAGTAMALRPGRTWVELVPTGQPVVVTP